MRQKHIPYFSHFAIKRFIVPLIYAVWGTRFYTSFKHPTVFKH